MTIKGQLSKAVDEFIALPDISEGDEGIIQAIIAMDKMREIIEFQADRVRELEEQLQMYKRV